MIPLALAERLGLGPDVLDALRRRDERLRGLRAARRDAAARGLARVAAVYGSMPKLRPDASASNGGKPLSPGGVGPTRRNTPAPRPRGRVGSASVSGAAGLSGANVPSLFLNPRHVRRDLRMFAAVIRARGLVPGDAHGVAGAFERALELIPGAPSADALRRRLRGLAMVVLALEEAGRPVGSEPCENPPAG